MSDPTPMPTLPSGFEQAAELIAEYEARDRTPRPEFEARLDRLATQEAVALAHLRDLWVSGKAHFLLVSPSTIWEHLDGEADLDLTPIERVLAVDSLLADERLEKLMKLIHEAFRRLVRVHAVLVADQRGKE